MPGRCCTRCGACLTKTPTTVEMTQRSARSVECDARTLCLECAGQLVPLLDRPPGRPPEFEPVGAVDSLLIDPEPFYPGA
jgi:hypothetical protein